MLLFRQPFVAVRRPLLLEGIFPIMSGQQAESPPAHHFSHPDLEAFTRPEFRTGGGTLHSKGGKVQQYVGNNLLAIRNQDTKTSEPSSRWRRTLGNADNMSSL